MLLIIRTLLFSSFLGYNFSLYPVLLIPGDIASQLYVRYTKPPPHLICGRQNEWFILWLNPKYFFPLKVMQDCLVQTIKLNYDPKTRTTFSPEFCEIQVPGFGSVDTINYLMKYHWKFVEYYEGIIKELENFGYVANKNILGAPYDFRKAPNEMDEYLKNLKTLIEKMSKDAEDRPVIIIAHSMGCLYLVRLMNRMDQHWKGRYIKTFISISAPYSGSIKAVFAVLSGADVSIPWIKPETLEPMLNSWPSSYYLLPYPNNWSKEVIVATKERNFTAVNMKSLLRLSKIKYAVEHYEDVVENMKVSDAPNVTIHCIFSTNIPTVQTLDYTKVNFPLDRPKIVHGDGDGSVNIESLKQCGRWRNHQRHLIQEHVIKNVNHFEILNDPRNLDIIRGIIKDTK